LFFRKYIGLSGGQGFEVVLLFGVREDVRLEVCGLCKFLVASVERANIRPVTRMDADVGAQVEVERETLATAFKGALEGFLAGMHQLVPLQLGALNKGLATLGTNVYPGTMGMEVFSHRRIVAKHFGAAFMRTTNRPWNFFAAVPFRFDPEIIKFIFTFFARKSFFQSILQIALKWHAMPNFSY
jgi:hypothetical protein